MPDGFYTPIIAFEFVQTRQEVIQLFDWADKAQHQQMIEKMDLGNQLDYFYMLAYSSFLFLFSTRCAKLTGQKIYYLGAVIAIIVLFSDAIENQQLLSMTTKLGEANMDKELFLLNLFTWFKWGGITLILVLLSRYFLTGQRFSKTIALFGLVNLILAIVAFLTRSFFTEIYAISVAINFILMIIYCFWFRKDHQIET